MTILYCVKIVNERFLQLKTDYGSTTISLWWDHIFLCCGLAKCEWSHNAIRKRNGWWGQCLSLGDCVSYKHTCTRTLLSQ